MYLKAKLWPSQQSRVYCVLDTDVSKLGLPGVVHREQDWLGRNSFFRFTLKVVYSHQPRKRTRSNKHGDVSRSDYHRKFFCQLATKRFILKIDIQFLCEIKTYSSDKALTEFGFWPLGQYNMKTSHRPLAKKIDAGRLSKKTILRHRR